MVTIGTFQKLEDAEIEAARLRQFGIDAQIVHGNGSGWMPYVDSSIEIQVDREELTKLQEHKDEILADRAHRCPRCQSANYDSYLSLGDHFRAFVTSLTAVLSGGRAAFAGEESFSFRCRECGGRFRVDSEA